MIKPRILILRLSSIGDILLSTPFLRQTRLKYPDATIDMVVKKQFSEIVKYNPNIDSVYEIDTSKKIIGLIKLGFYLGRFEYDFVFDIHNNYRTRILTALLQYKTVRRIKKDKLKRFILINYKKNFYDHVATIPERYLETGKIAGIKDDDNGLELFWQNDTEISIYNLLSRNKLQSTFIAIAPGAGFFTKRWPISYFSELISLIITNTNYSVVILGSEHEAEEFKYFQSTDRVYNFTGQLSLLETAALLSRSKLLVCNDSGIMHMAASVKVPILAIFGSTVQELGFFPYRSDSIILENKNLSCRPCSHIGRNKCPKKHFNCMMEITPQQVFDQFALMEK